MMRASLYAFGSTLLTCLVVSKVFIEKEQFYPATLYLTSAKGCLVVLGNMALVFTMLFGHTIRLIFLGSLREIEIEHLWEKVSGTLMDTLLMVTIFREEISSKSAAMFVFMVLVKIFHWLSQDRVDYIQQTPVLGRGAYLRIFSLMVTLLVTDLLVLRYCISQILSVGVSILVLFWFEYTLLVLTINATIVRFFLNVYDMRHAGRWEAKGAVVLYLDFITDMIKLSIYLAFFSITLHYYGMPLHIIRPLFLTIFSFRKRFQELRQYHRATRNLNERFPDATEVELAEGDTMCVICREEMTLGHAKRLLCGHILHPHCLRSWMERQQSCPKCRMTVLWEDLPAPRPPQFGAPNAHPPQQWLAPDNQGYHYNHHHQPLEGQPQPETGSVGEQLSILQDQAAILQQQVLAMQAEIQKLKRMIDNQNL